MSSRSQVQSIDPTAPYAALVLRAALGAVFIAHALLKLLVFTLPGTAQFFAAHGFPGWTAYPVFVMELIGGTLLIAGVYTRVVALALLPILAGAITVHWPNGWSFAAAGGGWEFVAFLIAALGAQALLGDGAFALGRALGSLPSVRLTASAHPPQGCSLAVRGHEREVSS
jgi:putative oxidoreductase